MNAVCILILEVLVVAFIWTCSKDSLMADGSNAKVEGTGSAFLWDKFGHIVTNYHIIAKLATDQSGLQSCKVTLDDAQGNKISFDAVIIGFDPSYELAVLKMRGKLRTKQEACETRTYPYYCHICNLEFVPTEALRTHFQDRHTHEGFICDTCLWCVANEHSNLHGPGLCLKPGRKRGKETAKEKRDKNWKKLGYGEDTALGHQHDSNADRASMTFSQQAGTISKNAYIVIKNRPCKVLEVFTSKTGKHGHAKCHILAVDLFTSEKLQDIVPSSHNVEVPCVTRTNYQLFDICNEGYVSAFSENGTTKDLRLPSDATLVAQILQDFGNGKDVFVEVLAAMGEEVICAMF